MIKKYPLFKWSDIQKDVFVNIKKAIMDAHALIPPDFSKYFILYTFATDVSYATMLTHKNEEDIEISVSFTSSTFKGVELNYTQVENKAYVVYKFVKHFRPYLLNSKTKVIVPYPMIRNVLI